MKSFYKALLILLIAVMVLPLYGCSGNTQKINWTMYGAWITGDGEVQETAELSISGKITLGETGEDTLELDIATPDSFPYRFTDSASFVSSSRKYEDVSYCVCPGYSSIKGTSEAVMSCFAICPEAEYVIFNWNDGEDLYFAASTDPDADPSDILTYFSYFVEDYNIDD